MTDLGDRLGRVPVPDDEAARARSEEVVRAAFAQRTPAPRTRFGPAAAPAFAAIVVALLVLGLTPPGQAVSNWVRDVIGRDQVRRPAAVALERLPAPGALLVESPEGPWVVRADGSKRLLGPYREATWSPRGRFVAATRPGGLLAVEPGGRVHWSLARPGARQPRWAPSGFRVAYLSGPLVRVVAGDGTADSAVATGIAAEWRPQTGITVVAGQKTLPNANVLAVAGRDGRVRALDVDTRLELWASRPVGARQLSWSGDGRRLLAVSPRALSVIDPTGNKAGDIALPPGATATEARFAPRGGRIAMVRRRRGASELVMVAATGRQRLLFAGAGRLGGVTWSPDGRWLLVSWPAADEFLFVRTEGPPRVQAVARIARDFDPRAGAGAAAPTPAGWCCAR